MLQKADLTEELMGHNVKNSICNMRIPEESDKRRESIFKSIMAENVQSSGNRYPDTRGPKNPK